MSVPYPIPVTATQVGTYFVGQYYKVMELQPAYVHQFYSADSTMLRVQGSSTESAAGLPQIHALIMSLNYTGFDVQTAHALESWSGGVVVMVSGSVLVKEVSGRRKFVETFFLAPQEKGYFVLNDVFHFIEEDIFSLHSGLFQAQRSFEPMLSCPISQSDLTVTSAAKTNGQYNFLPKQKQATELENSWEMNADDHDSSLDTSSQDHHFFQAIDDSSEEPVKHTYASVLLATSSPSPALTQAYPKKGSADLERNLSFHNGHHLERMPLDPYETSVAETTDEVLVAEDENEIRSVYVRNLPPDASESDMEEALKKFGNITPDGVVIRSRKDVGVCYAFVEFEEKASVHNAVKAGQAVVAGCQVYIEGRRPNCHIPSRLAKGRSRVRGSVQLNASKGRNGSRNTGRGSGQDSGFREDTKLRANGYIRPSSRQERGAQVSVTS